MPRAIAVVLSFALGFLAVCEDELDHDYIQWGEEVCEFEYESADEKLEDALCHTWACATDEVLVCATSINYGERCDETWTEELGCGVPDIIRVQCDQCSNW